MNLNPWHILIIEDSPDDRADMRQMLLRGSDRRFRFTETELGVEGLRKMREHQDDPYDCVLLDYYLPDMNGEELLAALSDGSDLPLYPVVVVTGSVSEYGPALLRAGAQDYIGKNWLTRESLTRAVENAIERHKLLTERKQAEVKLQNSEESYRMLFQSIDQGYCILEMIFDEHENPVDYRLLQSNSAFEKQTGIINAQNKTVRELFPQIKKMWFETYGKIVLTGEPIRFENYIKQINRWYDIYAIRLGISKNYQVAILFNDITLRKKSEDILNAKEERLRLALEAANLATWDWNSASGSNEWNTKLYEFLGYDPKTDDASYDAWARRVYPEDLPQTELLLQKCLEQGSEFKAEYRVLGKNDAMHWVEARGRFERDKEGNNLRSFGVMQDITERKHYESKLINAKFEADQASRAKSDFLSNMSHELRSPLNAILGFAQLLESGSTLPTPRQKACIDQILQAGWYLLALVNEILDLTAIESGKLSLSLEAVSLCEVLSDCQTMLEPQAEKFGVCLYFPQSDISCFAHVDRIRVKQVFINLLTNAIKYNREGGRVDIKYSEGNTAERIRINIQDTGIGLSAEKCAQLFQPFNRLGQETGSEPGTGIGLSVSKRLIELMGGEIGVESSVGVGTVFWIELPRDHTPQLAIVPTVLTRLESQVQDNAALHTVLYVEDNPVSQMQVKQIIKDQDLRMLSAYDGNTGIALALAHLPDIILMDINLPGINGFKVLEILQEDPSTANIPVIALSADASSGNNEKGLKAGFFRYITKPIKRNDLLDALADALKSSEIKLIKTGKTK